MTQPTVTNGKGMTLEEENLQLWQQFEQAGYGYERPKRGDIVIGTILELRPEAMVVDIGAKRDGFVPVHDLRKLDDKTSNGLQVGDDVPVFIERAWDSSGDLILSISRGKELEDWEEAQRLLAEDKVVELQVDGYNRGGVTVVFGQLRGFVPASHLLGLAGNLAGDGRKQTLASKVGEKLRLKLLEVERSGNRLVFSHRQGERSFRKNRKADLLASLSVGDEMTGVVTSLQNFGAFVDIGGADGLVHVTEIAHERVRHPRDKLEVAQEVEVVVIKLDKERKRIGLSIRRLLPDPWENVEDRYHPGQVLSVTITNVVDFGAFARLEPGVEGLIHISRLSYDRIEHPSEVISVGDEALVRILRIDDQRHRIGLSLKDVPQWVDSLFEEADAASDQEEPAQAASDQEETVAESLADHATAELEAAPA